MNMARSSRKMKSCNVSWRCNLNQESESYSFGLAKSTLKKLILSHHIEGINDTYSWILFCTFWKHQTSSGDNVSSSICLHWNHTTRTDGWLYDFIFWHRWRRSSIFIIYYIYGFKDWMCRLAYQLTAESSYGIIIGMMSHSFS